jgi:hypothetical protein
LKQKLDRAGRRIVRASGISEGQGEQVVSSPFLLGRIRAQIAAESENRAANGIWSSLAAAAWRAIPAMGLAAALSFGLLLYVNGNKSSSPAFSVDAYLGAGESGIDNPLFAERRPLTDEEVLTTLVSRDEKESAK